MKIFEKSFKITTTLVIFISFFLITIILGILFLRTDNGKILSILGSLIAGLIVAIIQFIIAWEDYKEREKLKELKLIKVMYDRDNRIFYEEYIKKANSKIHVMGVTAYRFFNHFADDRQNATQNAKVLLHKLDSGIKVKILLPNSDFLEKAKKDDFEKVKQIVQNIKSRYSYVEEKYFEVKYFDHHPAHSIFIVDDTCIVGPVFPGIESKYTPALYLMNASPIAIKYQDYFNNEWEKAHE